MNFLSGSFYVGRLFDINIRVHMLFVILLAIRTVTAGPAWPSELLFWVMLFGIILLHEFGHCFGARSVGGDAENILMWPLGGLAYAHAPMRPWPQFVTVAAGPAVNVVFCLLSAIAVLVVSRGYLLPGINPLAPQLNVLAPASVLENPPVWFATLVTSTWFDLLLTFYHVNLFLLAFNLLPIYPLDGGQLFHAIIWPFVGLQQATVIACQVGLVGCGVLGIWGITGGDSMMLIFIAMFGGFTCWQRLQAAKYGMIVEDPAFTPTYDPRGQRPGFWSRIFKTGGRRRRPTAPIEHPNPNPGGWEDKQQRQREEEAELDRLLKKVSEEGIGSLSYVERQRLERITRERQRRQRDFESQNRV